ncbi:MAG TPA: hypothetical protein VNA66_12980 [Gammaproteobacteria bacterium]|nr:hypothetical protein [Gammaproteobacteria bacterium]
MEGRVQLAIELIDKFADRTGLTSERTAQRYLWTDAFAVCTLLGFARTTGEAKYGDLAARLIDHVHATLGRHRGDDGREGWLSGLDERQARAHPTAGGLRIGKPFPERSPYALVDAADEWNSDGQYFHYLTKWMHALDQATRVTRLWSYNVWARELADRAFEAFTYVPQDIAERRLHPRRIYWKMSIDLTRPTVRSAGQHDAIDGYVTFVQLAATANSAPQQLRDPHVGGLADELASAIDHRALHTSDPLGLGGLLIDAARIEQLAVAHAFVDDALAELLCTAAAVGLASFQREGVSEHAVEQRLPFRELGLAIGIRAIELVADTASPSRLRRGLEALRPHLHYADEIEQFWCDDHHREAASWTAHRDINDVMLAAALAPEGVALLSDWHKP